MANNCDHYVQYRSKQKRNNKKIENNKLRKVFIKKRSCYYFDDVIIIEDFDFDILLDQKSDENILICTEC